MSKPTLLALALIAALLFWMAGGRLVTAKTETPPADPVRLEASVAPLRVAVIDSVATPVDRILVLRGQTAPVRLARLASELEGLVAATPGVRGTRVNQGDPLVTLSMEDRQTRRELAIARLRKAEAEHQAAQQLNHEGFQADLRLKQAYADLQAAQADLAAIDLEIRRTHIRAPFAGLLQERFVELGERVAPGDPVAALVDDAVMRVAVQVPQSRMVGVHPGLTGTARFLDGRSREGIIHYVAPVAEAATRSFQVELEIDNRDGAIRSGVSCELTLTVGPSTGHRISPALLFLDDDGGLRIKSVDDQNRVITHPVAIIRSGADGVWISGLEEHMRLIALGGGFAKEGDQVIPVEVEG